MDLATLQQNLPQLEYYCERLYNAKDPAERKQAEEALAPFSKSTEYTPHLRAILDLSENPYAQYFACSSLLRVVMEHSVRPDVKLNIRNYFLGFIEMLTKLCWYENDTYRQIVVDAKGFMKKGTPEHYRLGLMLLRSTVQEMHHPTPTRSAIQHRKTAVAFRDSSLLEIFSTSLEALRYLKTSADTKIQGEALDLALACLSFDFVGTNAEDSAEELATLQIPSQWRTLMEDLSSLHLFMDYYCATVPPLSNKALECLVRYASVRRSLFVSEDVRIGYLSALINITLDILQTQQGLGHHDNYHEFCRLLGRLRNNFQLSELVAVANYSQWIERVAAFTVSSLQGWQWSSSSVHYLLGLWTRLVSCAAYMKKDSPNLLTEVMPKIIVAYVNSRLESVRLVAQDPSLEDPLDNEEQLQDQLDSLPFLCRYQYETMSAYLCSVMDPRLQQYQQISSMGVVPSNPAELQVLEGQLTWFVYMIGCIIKGRLSTGSNDSQEVVDGDLSARVLGLVDIADSQFHQHRYNQVSRQRLDIAILHFFQNFRKVYVGEVVIHSSKVYQRLKESVNIEDHMGVLSKLLNKIAHNLKHFGACEKVVDVTLTLFKDLTVGYMSGKLLSKLDAIDFILSNHGPTYYSFLTNSENTRNRTTFYATLARMIFVEDSAAKFKTLTASLQQTLEMLHTASSGATNPQQLRQSVAAATVSGLFRDVLGIAQAVMNRRPYMMLFDWLYPQHFPTILCCLEAWADTPLATTPLLKFMVEFVSNKGQCMSFESSSPNGILLFREVSKVVVVFSTSVLQRTNVADKYADKYKGIALCLSVLSRALNGSYVNFGVFELYNDPALKNALDAAIAMALSIPLQDVVVYGKVAKSFFIFLEAVCHNHTTVIVQQPHESFVHLVQSMQLGLKSLDSATSTQCAMAIDNLATWLHRNLIAVEDKTTVKPAAQMLMNHLQMSPTVLAEVLQTLFEIALFEESFNQWSLSRPMLSLILVNQSLFPSIRAQLVSTQPPEKQPNLSQAFDKLMKDVDNTLGSKNRDRFTQNLTVARLALKARP